MGPDAEANAAAYATHLGEPWTVYGSTSNLDAQGRVQFTLQHGDESRYVHVYVPDAVVIDLIAESTISPERDTPW